MSKLLNQLEKEKAAQRESLQGESHTEQENASQTPDNDSTNGKNDETSNAVMTPRSHDGKQSFSPNATPSNENDTDNSSTTLKTEQPINLEKHINAIRAVVKETGSKSASVRYTLEERDALRRMIFEFSTKYKIDTNITELARSGLKLLLEDYKDRGTKSLTNKILKAIHK